MKVEFFHDVVCSFCFPMSQRMRKVVEQVSDIEIIHKSYALVWSEESFEAMFGSRKAAKAEILQHWSQANQNDELHRFNITGMEQEEFAFPTSKNGLLAAKAAGIIAGQAGYWEVFDKIQEALFMKHQNIELIEVLESCVAETSVDLAAWREQFANPDTLKQVEADFDLAATYGLQGVPALIVNEKYLINGAQPLNVIMQTLDMIREKEKPTPVLEELGESGNACHMVDGKWECD